MNNRQRMRTITQIRRRSRAIRRDLTRAEEMLWERLQDRQMEGLKVRCQHPIGPFMADFCCSEQGLVIEIDGDEHDLEPELDKSRLELLEAYGFRIIRFHEGQVLSNLEGVLKAIQEACSKQD